MWAKRLAGPSKFETIDTAAPGELQDGQVLLKLLAGGVCGSDIPNFQGMVSLLLRNVDPGATKLAGYPMHEVVGEVVSTRDETFCVGDRVVGWATGLDGLAEYVVTQSDSVISYSTPLPPTEAILIQPLACALYTIDRLAVEGQSVAVIGLGPIGLLMSHVAKTWGATRVTGVDKIDRSAVAKEFGVDDCVHSMADRWSYNLKDDERPSIVIEAAGHQAATMHDAIRAAAYGGRIFYFGIPDDDVLPFPINQFLRRNLTLMSGGVQDRQRWLRKADEYLAEHPELLKCITGVFGIEDAQKAYDLGSQHLEGRLKVVLDASSPGVQRLG
ncbi:zinc-binding dehydrogenase [Streptomyces chartreusis]|uniref:zinc-binding dehydrogenase n=1 Tax=Streptomyces chartreusis TaxID=1969 RepID=UPI00364DBA33